MRRIRRHWKDDWKRAVESVKKDLQERSSESAGETDTLSPPASSELEAIRDELRALRLARERDTETIQELLREVQNLVKLQHEAAPL